MDKEKERKKRFNKKLEAIKQHKDKYTWDVLGREFTVFPHVFNPGKDSGVLVKVMKIEDGAEVLDIGTGCGVLGIFAAEKAKRVVLTDINPQAVKNAEYNVRKFNLGKKIEVREGNLFKPIKQDEKFDVIIFNPPFGPEKPEDFLEMGMRDYKYKTLTNFFKQARNYLKPKGRVYMIFSDLGDMEYFKNLLDKYNVKDKILDKMKSGPFTKYIYELKFGGARK